MMMFLDPITSECNKFKQISLQKGKDRPHHLCMQKLLKLYSQTNKIPFVGPCYLAKFWGKKPRATTKVTLTSHQSNFKYFVSQFISVSNSKANNFHLVCNGI